MAHILSFVELYPTNEYSPGRLDIRTSALAPYEPYKFESVLLHNEIRWIERHLPLRALSSKYESCLRWTLVLDPS